MRKKKKKHMQNDAFFTSLKATEKINISNTLSLYNLPFRLSRLVYCVFSKTLRFTNNDYSQTFQTHVFNIHMSHSSQFRPYIFIQNKDFVWLADIRSKGFQKKDEKVLKKAIYATTVICHMGFGTRDTRSNF